MLRSVKVNYLLVLSYCPRRCLVAVLGGGGGRGEGGGGGEGGRGGGEEGGGGGERGGGGGGGGEEGGGGGRGCFCGQQYTVMDCCIFAHASHT